MILEYTDLSAIQINSNQFQTVKKSIPHHTMNVRRVFFASHKH